MAQFRDIDHMFGYIEFFKKGNAIKKKADAKIKKLAAKIKDRQGRIEKIRKDYDITDADLVELYRAMKQNHGASAYTIQSTSNAIVNRKGNKLGSEDGKSEKTIQAGVIANLDAENTAIQTERDQLERLSLLARNIDNKSHKVTFEELEYLGF